MPSPTYCSTSDRAEPRRSTGAMLAVVHLSNGRPEGQTYNVAGPTDGSFLITAVGGLAGEL